LKLGADDGIPELKGVPTGSGHVTFARATISFLAIPTANNASCR